MLHKSTPTVIQNDLSTMTLEGITAARASFKSQETCKICCQSEGLRLVLSPHIRRTGPNIDFTAIYLRSVAWPLMTIGTLHAG